MKSHIGRYWNKLIDAVLLSFSIVFLAEMGDKSQLISLAFATRYRAGTVLVAIASASLLLSAISTVLGAALALVVPIGLVQVAGGLMFLAIAPWMLRDSDSGNWDKAGVSRLSGVWVPLAISGAFFLAEFGDKTMLVTMTLAAGEEPVGVWLGSALGMVAANGIAVAIGAAIGTRLRSYWIRVLSAVAMVLFGLVLIAQGLKLF